MSIKTPCIVPGKQLAMEKHNTKTNKQKSNIFKALASNYARYRE